MVIMIGLGLVKTSSIDVNASEKLRCIVFANFGGYDILRIISMRQQCIARLGDKPQFSIRHKVAKSKCPRDEELPFTPIFSMIVYDEVSYGEDNHKILRSKHLEINLRKQVQGNSLILNLLLNLKSSNYPTGNYTELKM